MAGSHPNTSAGRRRFEADARQDAGSDLLSVLADRLRLGRRAAKRLLDERVVFVNGRRVWMARHPLAAGDRIEVIRPAPPGPPAIRILARTPEALVADKPPGILSNGGGASLESRLRTELGEPGLRAVHRLDRETSGCLWFARSEAAREEAVARFRAGRVRKVYEAIVLGRFPESSLRLDSPIEGRPALTRVALLGRTARASRLRILMETGRTHQIRRHLLEAGFPIAGDKQYGASRRLDEDLRALPRQMLHAAELEVPLASGPLRARSPLPRDFREALRRLGLGPGPGGGGENGPRGGPGGSGSPVQTGARPPGSRPRTRSM